jgi:hypothetical protein
VYNKTKKVKKRFAFICFMYKIIARLLFFNYIMSGKEDKIEVEGTIINPLPGLVFEVQLPEDF